jgi:hypothetical protein
MKGEIIHPLRIIRKLFSALGTYTKQGDRMILQTETRMPDPKQIPVDKIPSLLTQLAAFQTALAVRLIPNSEGTFDASSDRLLKVGEAAQKLRTTPDWLYRHWPHLPFTRRLGRSIRFSEKGLELFIQQLSTSESWSK